MNPATARRTSFAPEASALELEILAGLAERPKRLPCKLFYDEEGSHLFERICELDEYYLRRTEIEILRARLDEVARIVGAGCRVVEYGSGASVKTRLLLDVLDAPVAYVPIEISRGALVASARALRQRYPALDVRPVCADYTRGFDLPPGAAGASTLAFFPGSTLGNFEPNQAAAFLRRVREHCGKGGFLLLGVDLKKERAALEAAYDDPRGVTAEFNLNILRVLNREHRGAFSLESFRHRAVYDERRGRVEMHLVSTRRQRVSVAGTVVAFEAGEPIVTEHCYKYDASGLGELASNSGFEVLRTWTDARNWFGVGLFRAS